MTRHTRNKQMLKATKGKWGKSIRTGKDLNISNVPIDKFKRIEMNLDKSFRWKREFDVKSTPNLPNYRQRNDYYPEGFNTFYVTTYAEVSFKSKGGKYNSPLTVHIRRKQNGRKKVTQIFNGPLYGWESVTNV